MKRHLKKIISAFTLFSLELVLVWVIFIVALFVFLFVSKEIFYDKKEEFDFIVFKWIDNISSENITRWMKFITFFASREFIFVASSLIFIYFLFIKKHKWYSLKIPVVAIGSISLNLVLKNIFGRPRPIFPHLVEAGGLSFPSGHAMISFSFYGLMIYLIWREIENKYLKFGLILFLLILIHLIGLSRMYLKVHYPTDVFAGFALGILWLILSIFVLRKLEHISARSMGQNLK